MVLISYQIARYLLISGMVGQSNSFDTNYEYSDDFFLLHSTSFGYVSEACITISIMENTAVLFDAVRW